MFGFPRATSDVTWRVIEGDFLLGTCSRRIFGFATRSADGTWAAFDDDARPLGAVTHLDETKSLLWRAHRETHPRTCATAPESRTRAAAPADRSSLRAHPEPSSHAVVRPGSW